MTNQWAYSRVPGDNPGQQVGFGLPRGHYVLDQAILAPVQVHCPVNLNDLLFVGPQDHYPVHLNHVSFVGGEDHY